MAKLGGLLRTATRSNLAVRTFGASSDNSFSAAFLRGSPRQLSTESEPRDAAVESFLRSQSPGSVYGRLSGITRHTLRSDVVHLLDGCRLTLEDVKVEYNYVYHPTTMMVHFSSSETFTRAVREIVKKGRFYKLDRVGQEQWDRVKPYDGKTVLLQGLPREATLADIERFLSSCEYDASSIQMFLRASIADKMATIRFPSQTQAMNCFITKNKGFCMNNQVSVHVLH